MSVCMPSRWLEILQPPEETIVTLEVLLAPRLDVVVGSLLLRFPLACDDPIDCCHVWRAFDKSYLGHHRNLGAIELATL